MRCFCQEKITLVADYAAAVAAYNSAVREFEQGMITRSSGIYAKRRKATEEARALCEAVRKALNEHEAKHGC